ncbi:MAG: LptA/OstA family protein [Syntrophales bacterium]
MTKLYTHMMKNTIALFIVLLILSPFSYLYAGKRGAERKLNTGEAQPIKILSDRLEAYNEKKLVIFSGNAVANRGDMTIKSDRLLLYYRNGPSDFEKKGAGGTTNRQDLEKIEAEGNVKILQGDRIVTGDTAVFYQDTQKILISGNSVLQEGKNIIHGEKVIIFLDENRGIVEGAKNKRVTATIYPKEN